jgi:3-isopropylmalate/(R)-2-methylmalate dehydratase small subunit
MKFRGKAHKFSDNINTDYIISGKYKFKTLNMQELLPHLFEDIFPDFYKKIKPGDFIVAGINFGCGSSREQAPLIIKEAKISCILAKSFARIFFRNAINNGLPVIECDTEMIDDGDELEVDLDTGLIKNLTKNREIFSKPFTPFLKKILEDGGLENHFKKYGNFSL